MNILDSEAVPIFVIFTLSAVLHLPFSVGYHLFMSMDAAVFHHWRRLDVIAIFYVSILLTFALSYFVLPGWGCILNTLIAAAVAYKATSTFNKVPEDHVIDGKMHAQFVGSIILCYMFPMFYALVRDTFVYHEFTITSAASIGVIGSLVMSGWAYASFWPQKMWPGRFNVFLHSHQIMHIGVMVAHGLEFVFLLDNWRRFAS